MGALFVVTFVGRKDLYGLVSNQIGSQRPPGALQTGTHDSSLCACVSDVHMFARAWLSDHNTRNISFE